MDKKTKEELIKIIQETIPGLIAVTGGMGISFGENKKFYKNAKRAANKKRELIEPGEIWVPLIINNQVQIVCGLKTEKDLINEEAMVKSLYREFQYKSFLNNQVQSLDEPKRDFIEKLLIKNEIKNMDEAIEKGDILGINLRSPQVVMLIKTKDFFKKTQLKCEALSSKECEKLIKRDCDNVAQKISSLFKYYDQNITVCIEPEVFLILKWAKEPITTLDSIEFFKKKAEYIKKNISEFTKTSATIGLGQYYPGLAGLRKSLSDAKVSLEIGTRIWGEDNIYHISDIGMLISLSEKVDFDRKCELAHQILGQIISDQETFKTMSVFLKKNMSLTETAKELHIHRNTLIYRLGKIKEEVGLDPRKFKDAVQIRLGIMLYGPNSNNTSKN